MLSDWMKQNFYVFIDFETTGVPAEAHYPIQVGMIVTDSMFQVVGTYQSMIGWDDLIKEIKEIKPLQWPEKYKDAEQYHKISVIRYNMEGNENPNYVVVHTIQDILNKILQNYHIEDFRIILISDNIQFEWQLLRRMFREADSAPWPFHYCGWDTSLLLNTVGVGDPENPPHDALMDASGMHLAVVRSLEKLGFYEKNMERTK